MIIKFVKMIKNNYNYKLSNIKKKYKIYNNNKNKIIKNIKKKFKN